MFQKIRDLIGRSVLSIAGAIGGGVLGILLITCILTLTNAWSVHIICHILLAMVIITSSGALFPIYFVGFLSFLAVFNEDESDTPMYLFVSTLGYLVAVIALPLLLLFRIQILAVASLLFTLQFAVVYAYHLSVRNRLHDT